MFPLFGAVVVIVLFVQAARRSHAIATGEIINPATILEKLNWLAETRLRGLIRWRIEKHGIAGVKMGSFRIDIDFPFSIESPSLLRTITVRYKDFLPWKFTFFLKEDEPRLVLARLVLPFFNRIKPLHEFSEKDLHAIRCLCTIFDQKVAEIVDANRTPS